MVIVSISICVNARGWNITKSGRQCYLTMHIIMSDCRCYCHDDSEQNADLTCEMNNEPALTSLIKPILQLLSLLFGQLV